MRQAGARVQVCCPADDIATGGEVDSVAASSSFIGVFVYAVHAFNGTCLPLALKNFANVPDEFFDLKR